MDPEEIKKRIARKELVLTTSRSSGPGGQNINKVNTKVELRFSVIASESLTENEKEKILFRLGNRINAIGELIVVSQAERSQLANRKSAIEKLYNLLATALTEKRERRKTSATPASKKKRIENKRKRSEIKNLRKNKGREEE